MGAFADFEEDCIINYWNRKKTFLRHPKTICKFSLRCKKEDCSYAHPELNWHMKNQKWCRDGVDCKRPDCYFKHSLGNLCQRISC